MKRVNENGENEDSGSKKVKFFDNINENLGDDLDKNEGEEESVLAKNVGVDSAEFDRSVCPFGDEIPVNFDGTSFDMILGNEEEKEDLAIDLKLPAYCRFRNRNRMSLCKSDMYPYRGGKGNRSDDEQIESYVEVGDSNPEEKRVDSGIDSYILTENVEVGEVGGTNLFDQNRGNPPSSKKQQQLGDLPWPFSEALKLVRERASKGEARQLIEWRPLVKNQDKNISAEVVPSLLDMSLKALARSAEGLVSLENVPDCLRRRLSNIVCDIGGMNASFFSLLLEGSPTEIWIKNCSWLAEEDFEQITGKWQTKDLRVLQLALCGECISDKAFRNILDRCLSSFSRLSIVSLRGAYCLSDNGIKILVSSAPLLRSINVGQCALLTVDALEFIADGLGLELRELYIDECHKIDALQSLSTWKKFMHLEVLSVAGIRSMTDSIVTEIVGFLGQSLRELDFADCVQLTDISLRNIGNGCADLCSLNISNLDCLTDLGIEFLANGCRSIQKLKLRGNEFSDEALAAFLETSGESLVELSLNKSTKVGPLTALSLAKCSRKLLSLDLSWCRGISNEALGLIVDFCTSLKLLKIFGCSQITDVFLEGHSNRVVRIVGLDFTPILDHLYSLEPEEVLLRYSPLPD